jgi:hypothetical protein
MNFLMIFQVIGFLAEHKADIKKMILAIEALIPEAPGSEKAATVRRFIGSALAMDDKIDALWPAVAPIFNLFVAMTKKAGA